jgi:hypothetical protein
MEIAFLKRGWAEGCLLAPDLMAHNRQRVKLTNRSIDGNNMMRPGTVYLPWLSGHGLVP